MGEIIMKANEKQSFIPCGAINITDSGYQTERCDGRMSQVLMVVMLVLGFVTFFINLGVLIRTIKILRRTHDPKPAFYLIGNLAVSDLAIGLYVIIAFMLHLCSGKLVWGNEGCLLQIAVAVTACQATIFTILLIAVDKYLYIAYCLQYVSIVTTTRVWAAIIVTWILSLLIGCLPSLGMSKAEWCGVCALARAVSQSYTVLLLLTAVICPYGVVVALYSILLILALKIQKSRHGGSLSVSASRVTTHRLSLISKKSTKSSVSSKSRNTLKGSKYLQKVKDDVDAPSTDGPGDRSRSHTTETETTFVCQHTENNFNTLHGDNMYDDQGVDNETDKICMEDNLETEANIKIMTGRETTDDDANNDTEYGILVIKENKKNYLEPQKLSECEETLKKKSHGTSEAVPSWKNWNPTAYINHIIMETKDKVLFLKRCQAVKTVFLIIGSFTVTYVPFVVGSLIYSLQSDMNKDQCLLHALNTLLYFAIVSNSLANPLIYAYGYKEFRMKSKKFKGIFARERKPKI